MGAPPLNLNPGSLANHFQHPAHKATPRAQAVLVKADQVADALRLDDELIDGLVIGLE